jgi:hypothetical protein
MKAGKLFLTVAIALSWLQCKKDNNVGPGKDTHPDVGMYRILPHGVVAIPPHEVNLFCNVLDTAENPVDFLTANKLTIKENEVAINVTQSALNIRKRNTLDYHMDTILLLDVSTGVNLEVLKNAARSFVASIDPDQSIAIYTFSNTFNLVQPLTGNATSLSEAIDNISAGAVLRNLYGAIKQGIMLVSESYTPGIVRQSQVVVLAAGQDTKNEISKEEIIYTSQFTNVYAIGLGNDLDRDALKQIGNRGFYPVTDENKLEEALLKIQASIVKFADSYYRIIYQSSSRGAATQSVQLSILANAYNGTGSTMTESFKTDQFVNVSNGMLINWTPANPEGIDTLIIGINVPRRIFALSQGGSAVPVYEWSVADPAILEVEPVAAGCSEATLLAASEGISSLLVKDTANGSADTLVVRSVGSFDGFVLREWWENVSGGSINDLISNARFPDFPTGREYIQKMEGPLSFADNYGTRMRGFVHPSVSGTYSFWIASDDKSQLFFSMSQDPGQKVMVAKVENYTSSRTYDTYPSQHSPDFELEAGKFYYIEALHKEGGGGDNISVAWQGPGIARAVISDQNISAWLGN